MWKKYYKFFTGRLFRSIGIYLFSSFLNGIIPFLILPVLTRFLSPSDYGIVAMFSVLITFLAPFTGLSVHGAVYRKYFDLDEKEIAVYIGNVCFVLLTSSLITGLILFLMSKKVFLFTGIPVNWVCALIVVSMMNFLSQVLLSIWQVQEKPVFFGVYQNLRTLLNVSLSLFFVIVLSLSWKGRVLGIVVSSGIFGFLSLYILRRQKLLSLTLNIEYIKNALGFGIPMIPTALKAAIITITDKIFITNMVGMRFTGLYSVGSQLSMPIHLLTTSFNSAYVPWLFKKLKENDMKINKKIVRYSYLYFFILFILALIMSSILDKLLFYLVGSEFIGAKTFISWLSMGFAFSGMHSMVVNYIYFAQKTALYGIVSVVSLLLNITLNYVFISINGAVGAAQATCLTYLFTFLMTWRLSSKVFPMPWFYFLKGESKA
jgi:O-antigen/teichoic acid export membrane protein